MSFLRRLAAASNPPRIPNPNPANPVLVSVVPVFGNCLLLTLLEDCSVSPVLTTSEESLVIPDVVEPSTTAFAFSFPTGFTASTAAFPSAAFASTPA